MNAWRTAAERALGDLQRHKGPSARHVVGYVLTGSPARVLADLAATDGVAYALGVGWSQPGPPSPLERVMVGLRDLPDDAIVRWGLVADAAQRRGMWGREIDPVGGVGWPEAMLRQVCTASGLRPSGVGQGAVPTSPVPVEILERALRAAGIDPVELYRAAFRAHSQGYPFDAGVRTALRAMAGYPDAVVRHSGPLRAQLAQQPAKSNLLALRMLEPLSPQALSAFAPELAGMLTASSKQLRSAARPLAQRCGAALHPPLQELATSAPPERRAQALQALWSTGDAELRAWAVARAAEDRAPSVRALGGSWTTPPADVAPHDPASAPIAAPPAEAPRPPAPARWHVDVTPQVRAQVTETWRAINARIEESNRAMQAAAARTANRGAGWRPRMRPLLPDGWVPDVCRQLGSDTPPRPSAASNGERDVAVTQLGTGPLPVAGALRIFNELGFLVGHDKALGYGTVQLIEGLHGRSGRPTLLELATLLDSMGLDSGRLITRQVVSAYSPLAADWPDADVLPFLQHHARAFADILTQPYRDYGVSTAAVIRALGRLPALPADVADLLFDIALTGHVINRLPAQQACTRVPGRDARLAAALAAGKADVRTEAAKWLSREPSEAAVPALEAAVAKERQDVAKGAMLDALEATGRPVERYLDREALFTQAQAALGKGVPKDVAWLSWPGLPEVRWADTGEVVPPAVIQLLVVQAVRAKSPEPNAVLRKYLAMLEPVGKEALGQHLLEAWLAEDTRPVDAQTAAANAAQRATNLHQAMRQYPKGFVEDPKRTWSVAELTSWFMPQCLKEPAGSAIASKGLLAVAAACAGERAAAPTERYLREWYGIRAAQGKALIAMLAWVDHPTATQLVLSVGSRFRTKSFQEEATRQARALAERKGWTVTELADRTIPTAGLSADGVLDLSYGPRVFTAALGPDLTLVLRAPDGSPVASLPTPRQSDDAEQAATAKKAFAAARKELTALTKAQTSRLYEAMCTERTWPYDDWRRYLAQHPVMRHLVQRLVWLAEIPDGDAPVVFRPLDDGTLTDADDAEITLPDDAVVRLAHGTNLDSAAADAWRRHLDDYEVTALFPQLGAGVYRLPASAVRATEITDYRGHLLEAFRLRGRAAKLGYGRGSTEDGGWFLTYEKRFPTLDLVTVVTFSGNSLPEENRTVALETLTFEHEGQSWSRPRYTLGDVPPVLLAEAYEDLRTMAGDGPGFDPEWQKKVAM